MKKEREIKEEAEYLETLSTFHWVVYPFFKVMEKFCDRICGCKSKADEFNKKRRAEVEERQKLAHERRKKEQAEIKAEREAWEEAQRQRAA
jgi:hypothetical protein